jgi:hypothetical protein
MLFWPRGNFVSLFESTTAHAEAECSSVTELPNAHFWPYGKDFGQSSFYEKIPSQSWRNPESHSYLIPQGFPPFYYILLFLCGTICTSPNDVLVDVYLQAEHQTEVILIRLLHLATSSSHALSPKFSNLDLKHNQTHQILQFLYTKFNDNYASHRYNCTILAKFCMTAKDIRSRVLDNKCAYSQVQANLLPCYCL